jgi:hypothetical protein
MERVVGRSGESTGLTALVSMGMEDLAFEAIVIRHSELFIPGTIERAKSRLQKLQDGFNG